MKKYILLEIICGLFFLLFFYTGLSKIVQFKTFVFDLGRDPLIGKPLANTIGIILPIIELAMGVGILLSKTRKWGLYGTSLMMMLFTIYVRLMINSPSRHCTCGGVIREMTWRQHFWFNLAFTLLSFAGIYLYRNSASVVARPIPQA